MGDSWGHDEPTSYHWIGFHGKIYRKPWFLPSNINGFSTGITINGLVFTGKS
jgi:hypothetical protein